MSGLLFNWRSPFAPCWRSWAALLNSGPKRSALVMFGVIAVLFPHELPKLRAADAGSNPPATAANFPKQLQQNASYASSNSCKTCHPKQYESWHHSYHRTMTQVASPTSFVGKFDGSQIDSNGLIYRVFTREGRFWAEMPDPDAMIDRQRRYELKTQKGIAATLSWDDLPRVEREVVMSTGSHHYQTYWVESGKYPGTLMTLPLVYLIQDKQWIPRESAFMYPPGPRRMVTVWNDHCINCHSTGAIPKPYDKTDPVNRRILETGFQTHVGEIGIACEACHGPAAEHVKLRQAAAAHGGSERAPSIASDPIIQPANLTDHRRATYVCGQCHGVYIRAAGAAERFRDHGMDFVPGEDLLAKRDYIFPPQADVFSTEKLRQEANDAFQRNRNFFRERFWDNGQVLAGGREFTALAMSKCFIKGSISCMTCHSMHESDPDDQLRPDVDSGKTCVECHSEAKYRDEIAKHTHHKAASPGSNCLNCHMPRTTYALFTAIRSHQIASPDLLGSVQHGVPNACNLCHLDQTLGWTQDHLAEWFAYQRSELSVEQRQIAASLVWMLKGDAAQRVITVWHLGWQPAQETSGTDWLAPFAARLIDDPYGVVRYVARQSLRTLPGWNDFDVDFLASAEIRAAATNRAIAEWSNTQKTPPSRTGPRVLIDKDGKLAEPIIKWLQDHRDNRPVIIKE
ncbi:MAG: cytochrome c3 family protein [Pirellulales bacterium]